MVDGSFVSQISGFESPSRSLSDRDADQIRSRMAQSFGMTWVGADCAAEPYASYAVEGTQIALDAEIVRQTTVAAAELENLLLLLEDMIVPEQSADLVRTILAALGLQANDRDVLAAIARVQRRRAARPAPITAVPAASPPKVPVPVSVSEPREVVQTNASSNESLPSLLIKLIGTAARRKAVTSA